MQMKKVTLSEQMEKSLTLTGTLLNHHPSKGNLTNSLLVQQEDLHKLKIMNTRKSTSIR